MAHAVPIAEPSATICGHFLHAVVMMEKLNRSRNALPARPMEPVLGF